MDSVRPDFIALLNRIAASREAYVEFGADSDLREIALVAQLVSEGYLEGVVTRDHIGTPVNARISQITIKGRFFADTLEDEKANRTFWARAAKHPVAIGIGGIIVGIAITVGGQALNKWLGLSTP